MDDGLAVEAAETGFQHLEGGGRLGVTLRRGRIRAQPGHLADQVGPGERPQGAGDLGADGHGLERRHRSERVYRDRHVAERNRRHGTRVGYSPAMSARARSPGRR